MSATPLSTPFAEEPSADGNGDDGAKQLLEYKRKVARLKKLLLAANEHIDKAKQELKAKDAKIAQLALGAPPTRQSG